MRRDPQVMAAIEARAAARNFRLTDRIPRQANVPDGATVLPNEYGTAPGLYFPPNASRAANSPHLFLLPGPRRELQPMFAKYVFPLLRTIAPQAAEYLTRNYRIAGTGESHVEEAIGEQLVALSGIELGYCAKAGEVVVRVIGTASTIAAADGIIRERFADAIYATDETTLEAVVVAMLKEHGSTLSVAESCTGGLLANRITNVPGASDVFTHGYVTYSNAAKTELLDIQADLIAANGAVSEPVARAMAEGARQRAGATYALAVTGIAGPSGGTTDKPVGTVFIALASAEAPTEVVRDRFLSDRVSFKQLATQNALEMLRQRLRKHAGPNN
jgi:nicotinamide-nucleotide amidase